MADLEAPSYHVVAEQYRSLIRQDVVPLAIAGGCRWAEGPVWFRDLDLLLWSDVRNDRIMRWVPGLGASVFRAPSRFANGNTRDRQGRLITCEQGERRVTRTEADGAITVIADAYQGRRLNSPNDVVVGPDDAVWFSDPPYGILTNEEGYQAEPEYGGCFLFRADPQSGRVDAVATDFAMPNGLAFSPDGGRLYVSDSGQTHDPSGPHHIRVFSVGAGGRLTDGRLFADITPGISDGLRVDEHGNIWTSAGDGVHTYAPGGDLLGKIKLPAVTSNVCFGGPARDCLYVTATDTVWRIPVAARGAATP